MELSRQRLVVIIAIAVGIVVVFLAGYLPGRSRANRAAEESRRSVQTLQETQAALAKTQFDLEVAQLRGRLGEVLHEANTNNFGVAAERATEFFDRLRAAVNSTQLVAGSERRSVLDAILARRDEISADLARADPAAKAKLTEMYMQFAQAVE